MKLSMYSALSVLSACSFSALGADVQQVHYSSESVVVDGKADDAIWSQTQWHSMKYLMDGTMPDKDDFEGRYKIAWDEDKLYLLVEIHDDVLIDTHPDPKDHYWDDDALEVFIDEDASGGDHLYSYNAFAYHIALDGNVADFGDDNDDNGVVLLNDHVDSVWNRSVEAPYTITWEVAIDVYDDTFSTSRPSTPVKLHEDKIMGFMLAYCDNDGSEVREHFMGSHKVEPVNGDANLGFKDASVFGKIKLVK